MNAVGVSCIVETCVRFGGLEERTGAFIHVETCVRFGCLEERTGAFVQSLETCVHVWGPRLHWAFMQSGDLRAGLEARIGAFVSVETCVCFGGLEERTVRRRWETLNRPVLGTPRPPSMCLKELSAFWRTTAPMSM